MENKVSRIDLINKIASKVGIRSHSSAKSLVGYPITKSGRIVSVDYIEETKDGIIYSEDRLLDGKYYIKIEYSLDDKGTYHESIASIKLINSDDVAKLAINKFINKLKKLFSSVVINAYKVNKGREFIHTIRVVSKAFDYYAKESAPSYELSLIKALLKIHECIKLKKIW